MYEHLLTYLFDLEIGGEKILPTDSRRRTITEIQLTLRRNDSSSLKIVFSDPFYYWHQYFATDNPIKVFFRGQNLDGSAVEEFEGYVASVQPANVLQMYDIEVLCLDIPPTLNASMKQSRVFKGQSRKGIAQTLAREFGATIKVEDSSYLNQVEEEVTLSVNDTPIQFLSQILDDIGYRISIVRLNTWIITPKIPTTRAKHVHSNQGRDGSLLDFRPTFNPYMYEDKQTKDETDPTSGGDQGVDPDSKEVEEAGDEGTGGTFKDKALTYYDSLKSRWLKTK